jgi:uncharacterized protein
VAEGKARPGRDRPTLGRRRAGRRPRRPADTDGPVGRGRHRHDLDRRPGLPPLHPRRRRQLRHPERYRGLSSGSSDRLGRGERPAGARPEKREVDFVAFVFNDAQAFWADQFGAAGRPYENAKLIVYRSSTDTGCGAGSSSVGPFYCPLDRRVYLDLGFFDELNRRFQAPGDFAQAYVVAHEVGHHIQQQLGIDEEVRRQSAENPDDANELSVRLELQADCMAGVWGRSTYDRGILETGDLEEGINAAASVGDDRIQSQAQGRIDPESFTHGTSEQRAEWLRAGFDSGELDACDTFSGEI